MKKRLIALILVSAGFASAQTNAFLSWEQCLEKTKAYNPDLVSARAAVRELEFGVSSASSGFLPQISARAGIDYGEAETDSGVKENKSASGRLTLSQDLFSGGGNIAGRRRALAQLEIGNQQYRKTLSDVELRTRLAYIDVLYAQDLVELTKKIEERRHNNVRLIQLRFDGAAKTPAHWRAARRSFPRRATKCARPSVRSPMPCATSPPPWGSWNLPPAPKATSGRMPPRRWPIWSR